MLRHALYFFTMPDLISLLWHICHTTGRTVSDLVNLILCITVKFCLPTYRQFILYCGPKMRPVFLIRGLVQIYYIRIRWCLIYIQWMVILRRVTIILWIHGCIGNISPVLPFSLLLCWSLSYWFMRDISSSWYSIRLSKIEGWGLVIPLSVRPKRLSSLRISEDLLFANGDTCKLITFLLWSTLCYFCLFP